MKKNTNKYKNKSNDRHKKNSIGIPSSSKKKPYISKMENNLQNGLMLENYFNGHHFRDITKMEENSIKYTKM